MENTSTRTDSNANPNGSARAIEVVTMLGDAIVGVEHLEPQRRQPSRRVTRALFATGALMLVIAGVAFARAVSVAAANKAAYHQIVEVDRLPEALYHPARLGLGWDVLAFGGLLSGVLAIAFGLWRLRTRAPRTELTAGRGAGVDVPLAGIEAEQVTLVSAAAERTVLTVPAGMDARIRTAGVASPLADLIARGEVTPATGLAGGWQVNLPAGGSARLSAGPATVVVRSVPAATGRVDGLVGAFDRQAAAFLGGSALAHAIALLIMLAIPPTSHTLALDLGSGEARPTILVSTPALDPEPEPADAATGADDDGAGAELAMTGAEGTAGRPDSTADTGHNRVAKRSDTPQLSRQQAIELARTQGILGTDMAQQFRSMYGDADFSSGWDSTDDWGHGTGDGPGAGDFGGGDHGPRPGAGGPDDGFFRIGKDLWKHPGPGGPSDGDPQLEDRGPHKGPPVVHIGTPVTSSRDKETIRRYIRRVLDQIRYLYEKQLLEDPDLAGTVTVVFTISPQGAVLDAHAKGLGVPELEQQIADVIASIEFPALSHGEAALVRYPFNLSRRG